MIELMGYRIPGRFGAALESGFNDKIYYEKGYDFESYRECKELSFFSEDVHQLCNQRN